jgi:hypothetical protein
MTRSRIPVLVTMVTALVVALLPAPALADDKVARDPSGPTLLSYRESGCTEISYQRGGLTSAVRPLVQAYVLFYATENRTLLAAFRRLGLPVTGLSHHTTARSPGTPAVWSSAWPCTSSGAAGPRHLDRPTDPVHGQPDQRGADNLQR